MKYVLLTEKEFELYEKMVNEGKIGKFLTTGAIALGLFGGGQQANAMNYDYMKKNPNSATQLSEIDGQWFQEAAIRFVELGDSLLNTKNKVQQKHIKMEMERIYTMVSSTKSRIYHQEDERLIDKWRDNKGDLSKEDYHNISKCTKERVDAMITKWNQVIKRYMPTRLKPIDVFADGTDLTDNEDFTFPYHSDDQFSLEYEYISIIPSR